MEDPFPWMQFHNETLVTDVVTRSRICTISHVSTTLCATLVWAGTTTLWDIIPSSIVTFARRVRKRGRLLAERQRQQRNEAPFVTFLESCRASQITD